MLINHLLRNQFAISFLVNFVLRTIEVGNCSHYPHAYYHRQIFDEDIKGNITSFVEQFESLKKRKVVTLLLMLCPYTPLCNYTLDLTVPPGYESVCKQCRCDINCFDTDSCCPDIVPDWKYDESTFKSHNNIVNGSFDQACLPNFGLVHTESARSGNLMQSSNCTSGYNLAYPSSVSETLPISTMTNIMDIVPVSCKADGKTYLNRHCTQCEPEPEVWNTYITCRNYWRDVTPNTRQSMRIFLGSLNIPLCWIEFRSNDFEISECGHVSSCDQKQYDEELTLGCSAYESLFQTDSLVIFKNIHCLACNGFGLNFGSLKNDEVDRTFVGKLNYAMLTVDQEHMKSNPIFDLDYQPTWNKECPYPEMYDEFMEMCFSADCPPIMLRYETICKALYTEMDRTYYDSFITLSSDVGLVLANELELHQVYDCISASLNTYESYIDDVLGYNITFRISNIYAMNRLGDYLTSYPMSVTYITVDLSFYFDKLHPVALPMEIMTNASHLSHLKCNIRLSNSGPRITSDYTLSVQVINDYRWGELLKWQLIEYEHPLGNDPALSRRRFKVFELCPCVFVKVCQGEVTWNGTMVQWNETLNGLFFPINGQLVSVPEFYYPLNEQHCIRICIATLHRVITSSPSVNVTSVTSGTVCCYTAVATSVNTITLLGVISYFNLFY